MEKLIVKNLCLELTRRCNMCCAHCLRGDAEEADMQKETLLSIFSGLAEIGTLTFTGGEPTLAVERMEDALAFAKAGNIQVRQVYVVTNGKLVTDRFLKAMTDWNAYCLERALPFSGKIRGDRLSWCTKLTKMENLLGAYVALSADRFHEPIPVGNLARLCFLPHLVLDKMVAEEKDDWLLAQGRAADCGMGRILREWEWDGRAKRLSIEDNLVDELYISVTGDVLKHCDYSYESQKDFALEHIGGRDTAWAERLIRSRKETDDDE